MRLTNYLLAALLIFSVNVFAQTDSDKDKKKKAKENKNLPLKPERFYELKTDTGTWMSLDISPDGQKIVFDLLGDIYIMPITGGKANRVTKGMAFDTNPRFSYAHHNLGTAYVSIGKFNEAKKHFEEAIRLNIFFYTLFNNQRISYISCF